MHYIKLVMHEVKGPPGLQIKVPPGNAFACQTPESMPKMHFLCACVGKRGSGKLAASVNLLEKLQVIDRLFYVSPSVDSNSVGLQRLSKMLNKEDMYSDVNDVSILSDIIFKIERERDEYMKNTIANSNCMNRPRKRFIRILHSFNWLMTIYFHFMRDNRSTAGMDAFHAM